MILWECSGCFETVESEPHSHSDWGGKITIQGPRCHECDQPMDAVEDLTETETMKPIDRPEPMSTWRHLASGGTYTVLGVSRCSTNGPDEGREVVVYVSHTYQQLRHRDLAEFMDGRFERVPAAA